jgi:hypothetical protein
MGAAYTCVARYPYGSFVKTMISLGAFAATMAPVGPRLRTAHRRAGLRRRQHMMSFGPWFLTHWTRGRVPPSRPLLGILLLGVVIYALWSTSSTLATATNLHQRLAVWYIVGTGVTVIFTYVLARRYGLYGAAGSLILSEVIMNFYVLPASLRIAHDTFPAFIASLLHYPHSLKPANLLARLSRSKPTLEAE